MGSSCPHAFLRSQNNGVCVLCDPPVPPVEPEDDPDLADLEAEERELEASIYIDSFSDFFQAGWHVHEPSTKLVWGWAYEAVCNHLQALVEDWARRRDDATFVQRFRNLLVTLPRAFSSRACWRT